jgi:hypothetical protein
MARRLFGEMLCAGSALDGVARSPSSLLGDTSLSFIRLLTVPLRHLRTECANQPVAFISSFNEAQSGRLSRPRT